MYACGDMFLLRYVMFPLDFLRLLRFVLFPLDSQKWMCIRKLEKVFPNECAAKVDRFPAIRIGKYSLYIFY